MTDKRDSQEQGFTPGPWQFTGGGVQTTDGAYVCELSSPRGSVERDATGRLIAAAPELYEAMVEIAKSVGSAHLKEIARGALAKARLQSPEASDG